MNKAGYIFVFILTVAVQNVYGQKMPEDYFAEGEEYLDAEKFDSALFSFEHIVRNNPRNMLYAEAFYNTGYAFFLKKEYDSAIKILKEINYSIFNDKSSVYYISKDPCPYYFRKAGKLLSTIYENIQMYDSALFYLALTDTSFSSGYEGEECEYEWYISKIPNALKKAELNSRLHLDDKMMESLLQVVFLDDGNNREIISQLKPLLKKKSNVKAELDTAITHMYIKRNGRHNDPFILFEGIEIQIPWQFAGEEVMDVEQALISVKRTAFYHMVERL